MIRLSRNCILPAWVSTIGRMYGGRFSASFRNIDSVIRSPSTTARTASCSFFPVLPQAKRIGTDTATRTNTLANLRIRRISFREFRPAVVRERLYATARG